MAKQIIHLANYSHLKTVNFEYLISIYMINVNSFEFL